MSPNGSPDTEHRPHIGSCYASDGVGGQRVAIMGYSHWGDPEEEGPHLTELVLGNVMSGAWKIRFFSSICRYFGGSSNADFWSRVIFFNFIPNLIGSGDVRFAAGTDHENARGRGRLQRILDEHQPHKLFVFTQKGWSQAPETIEEQSGRGLQALAPDMPYASSGTYARQGGATRAIGLRHPQGAKKDEMVRAVRAGLALT